MFKASKSFQMKNVLPRFKLGMDVYGHKNSFDHLKVVACIEQSGSASKLDDYEDVAIVADAIVNYWSVGRNAPKDEVYEYNEWLKVETKEEEGYVQAYAERVVDESY